MQPATDSAAEFLAGFVAAEGCFTGNGARRSKPHYDDEVQLSVQSVRELVEVIVPFMDAHLPPSHKRRQYLEWRARLLDHWAYRARRRATCTVDGCTVPAKAHGLCRHHLWLLR